MGLDMYAHVGVKKGQREQYWDQYGQEVAEDQKVSKPREIAYWRKHPNLHGWMEQLWIRKLAAEGKTPQDSEWGSSFNGVELELTWEDLEDLERAVTHGQLPTTGGFFFGNPVDEHYRKQDLEFIKNARAELFLGLKVFYNSSW